MDADSAAIQDTLTALQELGVEYVLPTHCSGDPARAAFRQAYGERCLEGGAGRHMALPGLSFMQVKP
jgi:7,8-dihydropterin-6-yl-methyl-4-(beta-D-ribofuranosyl)aminobenzene 5'-phosphate synthase